MVSTQNKQMAQFFASITERMSGTDLLSRSMKRCSTLPRASDKSRLVSDHLQVDVSPVERESTAGTEKDSPNPHNSAVLTPTLVQPRLEPYVGKYLSKWPPLKISIGIEGDHLSLIVAGRPRRALSLVSQTKFVIAGAKNGWIDFTPDARGRIDSLCLVEQDKVIVAHRQ